MSISSYPIELRQNADLWLQFDYAVDGVAVDLTSYAIAAEVSRGFDGDGGPLGFALTVTKDPIVTGRFLVQYPKASILALCVPLQRVFRNRRVGYGSWELLFTDPDAITTAMLEGPVTLALRNPIP